MNSPQQRDELRKQIALIMSRSIVDGHFSCEEIDCHQDGSSINQVMELIQSQIDSAVLEARIDELKKASDMQQMMRRADRVKYCSDRIAQLQQSKQGGK